MANGATGILTAGTQGITTPEEARRAWPQWLALGLGMIAVAVASVFWDAAGARLLLGALGLFLAVRGARAAARRRAPAPSAAPWRPAPAGSARARWSSARPRSPSPSPPASWRHGCCWWRCRSCCSGPAVALLGRGAVARRGGQALLVWTVLVTGLLVATGVAQGWARASDVATVVAALAVAVLAVPLILASAGLRRVAARAGPAHRRGRRPVRGAPAAPVAAARSASSPAPGPGRRRGPAPRPRPGWPRAAW